jgi:hypothetical protein
LTGKGGGGDLLVFYGTDYRGSIVSLTYKEIVQFTLEKKEGEGRKFPSFTSRC